MKSGIKLALMMFALMVGMSVTAAAQSRSRTRDGRGNSVYQNDGRGYRRDDDRNYRRNGRDYRRDRDNDWRSNRRDNDWRSNRRWPMQNQRQVNRGQKYRLPNGRIVTILPNGRRIYR